jgi:hypothetical protein
MVAMNAGTDLTVMEALLYVMHSRHSSPPDQIIVLSERYGRNLVALYDKSESTLPIAGLPHEFLFGSTSANEVRETITG